MATSEPDYNTCDFNGHVNIGDYKLHVQLAGRPREDEDPLIILIHGTAGHLEQYAAVIRALQPTQRLLAYTRRGLGHSDPYPSTSNTSPQPPTLDSIAAELTALLTTTGLSPPYILIGHSWGGMISIHIASTFNPTPLPDVQGLLLLDGGMPTLPPHLPSTTPTRTPDHQTQPLYTSFATDPGTPFAHPSVLALLSGLDTFTIQDPPSKLALTHTEHTALLTARSTPHHAFGTRLELQGLFGSYLPFASQAYQESGALSRIPICMLHAHAHADFEHMFSLGVARGNGTAAERADMQRLLSTWREDVRRNQAQFLGFAKEEKLGRTMTCREGTGHAVMMQDVGSVVRGLGWVVGMRGE